MTDSMAIGGLDKYFMQAYNSPNYYQLTAQTQSPVTQTANPSVAFKGNEKSANTSTTTTTKGSNAKAWAVLGTVATVGAAALCHRAGAIKGANGFWNKIGKGGKEIWENAFKKDFWKKMWQGLPENNKSIARFSATVDNSGEIAFVIPGKTKTIKGADEIAKYAEKYGIDTNGLAITSETKNAFNLFKSFELTTSNGDVIKYQGDEIVEIVAKDRKNPIKGKGKINEYLNASKRTDLKTEINSAITRMKENNFDDINIQKIEYQLTRGDDVFTVLQKGINDTDVTINELKTLERFSKNSTEVNAYFFDNPNEKEIFEKLTQDNIPEALKTISRPVKIDGVTYQIKDDTIEYLLKNGKKYYADTEEFKAFFRTQEKIDDVLKKCLETTGKLPAGSIISIK